TEVWTTREVSEYALADADRTTEADSVDVRSRQSSTRVVSAMYDVHKADWQAHRLDEFSNRLT
ncbi:hypothetical protein R0J87_21845, partial [Halomonas sp. SIMBA_159]